jgi:hypothetical protein
MLSLQRKRQMVNKNEKIVAYIDLLAFSNHIKKNTNEAMMLLSNYNAILSSKIGEERMNPVSSYVQELKEIAKNNSIDSFEYFIPFSDSIFIVSDDTNSFIKQLSSFLYQCFHFTSHIYEYPKDKKDPTKGDMINLDINENGQLSENLEKINYYPTFFRGGMAYGEVIPFDLSGITDKNPTKQKNIAGKAVVRAVELEKEIKGPRVVFDNNILKLLNEDTINRYVRPVKHKQGLYEILWPAIKYIPQNGIIELQHFHSMLTCAINLWLKYKDTEYNEHYWRFVELVILSTFQFFSSIGYEQECLDTIKKALHDKALDNIIDCILS